MRVYDEPSWEYIVQQFEKVNPSIKWIKRFRMPYYGMYVRKNDYKWKLLLKHCSELLQLFAFTFIKLFKPSKNISSAHYIILLSDNNAYLQNMLPVCRQLIAEKKEALFFCGAAQKQIVVQRLQAENLTAINLITENELANGPLQLSTFIKACLLAPVDTLKWMTSGTKFAMWNLPNFLLYAIHHHFYVSTISRLTNNCQHLIAANDHWLWETLFFDCAAANSNCNSTVLQHGLIGDFGYPMQAKQYAVWGEADKKLMLEKYEARKEEVKVVGAPYFDDFSKKCKAQFSFADRWEQPDVVFFSEPYFKYDTLGTGEYAEVVSWLMQLGNELFPLLGKRMVLKIHPLDKASFYQQSPGKIEIVTTQLAEVLKTCCLAYTVDSAALFEAAVTNIPTVQLQRHSFKRKLDFSPTQLTRSVFTYDELKTVTQQLLTDKMAYTQRQQEMQKGLDGFFSNRDKAVSFLID